MIEISVVTVSYNMGPWIGATIESVLSQGYKSLQYIIVDGGSTDETMNIVRQYGSRIDTVICEPDDGQYDAINKGMALARGEIVAWLNADDMYFPWTFSVVAEVFEQIPDARWITGLPTWFNQRGQCVRVADSAASYPRKYIANGWYRGRLAGYLQQESMFWRKDLWSEVGGLDTALSWAADFDLWTRFAQQANLVAVAVPLGGFRSLPGIQRSDIGRTEYELEVATVCKRLPNPPLVWRWLARSGAMLSSITRLFVWKRSEIVTYAAAMGKWQKITTRRPLSRLGLTSLVTEWRVRRVSWRGRRGRVTRMWQAVLRSVPEDK